jgi:gliding motility-associated-like protein
VTTFSLPPIAGGYTVVHQRCCRNNTITNITNPGARGNSYFAQIPSNDVACNSSPAYATVPPIVLCLGDDAQVDVSVTETDGDSLHYELCDIFNGGSSGNPQPSPPTAPPYTALTFVSPYTATQPLPGTFTFDSQTGLLEGKPTTTGQFVVGLCVSDYRNGVLLTTVRRDYQFNVTACINNIVADVLTQIEDPGLLCGGKTVQFQAQTPGALYYFWDFGVAGTNADTSNSPTPTFTFPDTGWYDVTFIVNRGLVCTDTVTVPYRILDAPNYTVSVAGTPCFDVQDFVFTAVGTTPVDATFSWTFGAQASLPMASGKTVGPIDFNAPGKYPVKLVVHSATCPDTLYDSVEVFAYTFDVDAGPDTAIARGDTVYLAATDASAYRWFADKAVYFNNPRQQAPQAWLRLDSTTFYVIGASPEGCLGLDTVLVYWLPKHTGPALDSVMNAITPNGDGKNDVLDLTEVLYKDVCRLIVYNRWGAQVYRTDAYKNDWAGTTSDGDELPAGTYYFYVIKGLEIRYRGPVSILR